MAKHAKQRAPLESASKVLKGWQQITAFLGHPDAVVQRWAAEGMPVHREGRYVATTEVDLNAWMATPVGQAGQRRD